MLTETQATYSMIIYKQPGIGEPCKGLTRNRLFETIEMCLENNWPFTVGHEFGNIDGSHPKDGRSTSHLYVPKAQYDAKVAQLEAKLAKKEKLD